MFTEAVFPYLHRVRAYRVRTVFRNRSPPSVKKKLHTSLFSQISNRKNNCISYKIILDVSVVLL